MHDPGMGPGREEGRGFRIGDPAARDGEGGAQNEGEHGGQGQDGGERQGEAEQELPLLEAIARDHGDPALFPAEVQRLYQDGKPRQARRHLLKHAKSERNAKRAALQRQVAGDLRVWMTPIKSAPAMWSLNGIGTRLVGDKQLEENETYISTLWFTLVFLPIWPISSFLVAKAEKRGWHFLARTPIPPAHERVRYATGLVIVGLIAFAGAASVWAGAHADLFVYNGFDRPVVAQVQGERRTVEPRGHELFEDLPLEAVDLFAAWPDESDPFERVQADLGGHGRNTVIYNVGSRGLIALEYIVYGPGEPRPGEWLDGGPVLFVTEDIDYRFADPPDSIRSSRSGAEERSVLRGVGAEMTTAVMVASLLNQGRVQQAVAMARAELSVNPGDASLAFMAANASFPDDRDGQAGFLRGLLGRAPEAVDLHRVYQELWPEDDRDPLQAEYAALLQDNPESPMYHYLAGRIEVGGAGAEVGHYRTSLALDPEYGPAFRALGYEAMSRSAWSQALAFYDRFAALGGPQSLESMDTRLRLKRRLGHGSGEMTPLLDEGEASATDLSVMFLRGHFDIESDPASFEEVADDVLTQVRIRYDLASPQAFHNNVTADFAVTAGDLGAARDRLTAVVFPENRDPSVALRLAMSTGAEPSDRELLTAIPGWESGIDPLELLIGLEWIEGDAREDAMVLLGAAQLGDVAEALSEGGDLLRPGRLDDAVGVENLRQRAYAAFAAARLLADEPGAAAARARSGYLAVARSFALPGELPLLDP